MNVATSTLVGSRHFLFRIRFQLIGGLTFAIVAPALIRIAFKPDAVYVANLQVTVAAAVIAHVAGFLAYRRIGNFPGVAAASYILPTFVLSYGLVFLTIFFFRFEYSRFQAAASFTQSTLWYFGLSIITRHLEPYRLVVIPGGNVERLRTLPGVHWFWITSPGTVIERANGVVVDLRADLDAEWERYIADRALSGTPVYHVKQVSESLTGRVEIEHLSENTLGSLNPNQAYLKIKQAIDWISALVMVVALSPFVVLIALLIRLDSEGPVLFRQPRIGYRGRIYTVYKFRSMRQQAGIGSDKDKAITKRDDDRITRIGRFLRKFRIDELPQAINILRGEMSWIGPRPEAVVLSHWYEAELPFYRYRHIVRPGVSGWAQVNQGHVAAVDDVMEKLHYDFYYIKNFSPWLDVLITLRTIKTMITGHGAR
ncbi:MULTISPECIES: sugar transferase [unclassified Mesorhizobium]|uniref:sugar transferase n=1 Tax=unclassified Mesorhizobium TaxID=325217 RepID=UPI00112E9A1E|nr:MULTISPECIES: sugar transferase [unclassified Mesorhizobium]MBZ9702467.1 sugar transferase [Mesorhizobium sp. CO1-1-3]MBZ9894906.1 sugar transferase [Mesorhizobium sp. BR1-1-6]MBZ9948817.1 sugar transferase [Mesorhizobium sp. BR1-1-11]MBZ9982810.1 sugar transferase [Mesorhizobium sp. BR-1-1-8]MCA0002025.1 sugar transferase [Mesorhizobium sp. B264B2A]